VLFFAGGFSILVFESIQNPNVMKRRAFKVLNFFAFNLLFFALYLNFIHKDKNVQEAIHATPATHSTVMVENTEVKEAKTGGGSEKAAQSSNSKSNAALKLSFN
jgi:hypothetical protein